MAGYRISRTSEDIKREIAAIMRELKDPRVNGKMLTVVRAEVNGDMSFVKVYVSALEGIETATTAVKSLNGAAGYIRREIGQRLHLRKTPEIKFIADNSVEHGMEIFRMLDDIKEEENED